MFVHIFRTKAGQSSQILVDPARRPTRLYKSACTVYWPISAKILNLRSHGHTGALYLVSSMSISLLNIIYTSTTTPQPPTPLPRPLTFVEVELLHDPLGEVPPAPLGEHGALGPELHPGLIAILRATVL